MAARFPTLLVALFAASVFGCSSSSPGGTTDDTGGEVAGDTGASDTGSEVATDAADAPLDAGPCDGATTWATLQRLSPADLDAVIKAEAPTIIDVHVPYAGTLPGTATSIAYTDVDALEAFLGHDKCANVVLTCHSGGMSLAAGNELVARGYLRVRDLLGGMSAWEAAGYPLVK